MLFVVESVTDDDLEVIGKGVVWLLAPFKQPPDCRSHLGDGVSVQVYSFLRLLQASYFTVSQLQYRRWVTVSVERIKACLAAACRVASFLCCYNSDVETEHLILNWHPRQEQWHKISPKLDHMRWKQIYLYKFIFKLIANACHCHNTRLSVHTFGHKLIGWKRIKLQCLPCQIISILLWVYN